MTSTGRGGVAGVRRPWSELEIEALRLHYAQPIVDLSRLAKKLKRTHASVALKASRLGLGIFERPKAAQLSLRPRTPTAAETRAHDNECHDLHDRREFGAGLAAAAEASA